MLRSDLSTSVDNLLDAFEHSCLINNLKSARDAKSGGKEQLPQLLMNSLNDFSIQSQKFEKSERMFLYSYNCEKILDPSEWVNILPNSASDGLVYELYTDLEDLKKFLLNFKPLIEQKHNRLKDDEPQDHSQVETDEGGLLTVILNEDAEKNSSPDRFVQMFEAINLFYESFAILEKKDSKIVLADCDSGDAKSFDFLGDKRIITLMKELILELWDRVMFNREKQLESRIDSISNDLLIFDAIQELEKNKSLKQVEAKAVRDQIQQGAVRFIATGATIPEMDQHTTFIPKALMTPQAKLVPEVQESDTQKSNKRIADEIRNIENLTDFEETGFSVIAEDSLGEFEELESGLNADENKTEEKVAG